MTNLLTELNRYAALFGLFLTVFGTICAFCGGLWFKVRDSVQTKDFEVYKAERKSIIDSLESQVKKIWDTLDRHHKDNGDRYEGLALRLDKVYELLKGRT